jgi:hypothetical protein
MGEWRPQVAPAVMPEDHWKGERRTSAVPTFPAGVMRQFQPCVRPWAAAGSVGTVIACGWGISAEARRMDARTTNPAASSGGMRQAAQAGEDPDCLAQ